MSKLALFGGAKTIGNGRDLKSSWSKKSLEQALCEYTGAKYAKCVSSGTAALISGLFAAGCGPGDEVLTVAYTWVATVGAILRVNAVPVFADVDVATWTLDPERCAEKITPRTGAILATHVYGLPCDVEALEGLAREHDLKLVFDASHSFGCRYRGRPLACYGDVSTLSLHATKIFHTAEGGLVCTADPEVARRVCVQRDSGFDGLQSFALPGINAKLSEFDQLVQQIDDSLPENRPSAVGSGAQ